MVKRVLFSALVAFCLLFAASGLASAADEPKEFKDLNFVFVHGAGGNSCSMQLLSDVITEQMPGFISAYEQANPGTRVRFSTLNRCYPDDVDIATWADNIATSVDKYVPGKGSVILIGHSMGGKTSLYTVAKNVGGLAGRVPLVVTINSPIKPMSQYEVAGGGPSLEYCRARWLRSDRGVCSSVTFYDSSDDGKWVGRNRHWLAFISAENAPASQQCNYGGIDLFPKDMDDGIIPISAQYADGADAVYYGEYEHREFGDVNKIASFMARQILQYIFVGSVECSILANNGSLSHKAGWLMGTDYWQDLVGDVAALSGMIRHQNQAVVRWQEWEDTVEYVPPTYDKYQKSRYDVKLGKSSSHFASIQEARWLNPDDPEDFRLSLRTKAAPQNHLQADWTIYRQDLLPIGQERDHYEVEIIGGSPLTGIDAVSWASANPRDMRLLIQSHAERPYRWLNAQWRVYSKETRYREKVIEEIPTLTTSTTTR